MWELYKVRYEMELGLLRDTWRLFGMTNRPGFEHGIYPSPPVAFDPESKILTTANGNQYKIVSCESPVEKVFAQLEQDIKAGGFERH